MTFPEPGVDAVAHSKLVHDHIAQEIGRAGGWISFARYMELALYAPGFGYYYSDAPKFGDPGDFITAPELSRLFGRTLARQVAQILTETNGDVLEVGAGSGRLAVDLLEELNRLGCAPRRYLILEVSADLIERQRALIEETAAEWLDRVIWSESIPQGFRGVIIANEVLDALPAHRVVWHEGTIDERGVAVDNGRFAWRDRRLTSGELFEAANRLRLASGYVSEINLAARKLVTDSAAALDCGAMLFIDYGFAEGEYYHAQRSEGTLICHHRHRAHDDPFYLPGLQDITTHVDFSAIAEAARATGLAVAGFTSQARFLMNCGILDLLAEANADQPQAVYLQLARQARQLLDPVEMGELFKAIAFTSNLNRPLIGFRPTPD